jgi:hypothetical protein
VRLSEIWDVTWCCLFGKGSVALNGGLGLAVEMYVLKRCVESSKKKFSGAGN